MEQRIKVIIEGHIPVTNLYYYSARSIGKAAQNQMKWIEENGITVEEVLSWCVGPIGITLIGEEQ